MSTMPNKEIRVHGTDAKVALSTVQNAPLSKAAGSTPKVSTVKTAPKELAMSPGAPPSDPERTELLGSLTTEQQQRTSARVIKKLRLEPLNDKRGKGACDDIPECETPGKMDEKDPLKFPTVKQRMPKALWSTDEKNLFFEALNEYGKDFDAITAHICAKMKKKGMLDANLKTKTQVSHFYYRTWHKLSKHVDFDENVKKVAQELYALINYGELRKKLVSVSEKTCAKLGEMVLGGSMVVRARGRNVRVRTPMCRALRRLNQITERACGTRVCGRALVVLRARSSAAWARVQAAAHNPRALVSLPLRARLDALLAALARRWRGKAYKSGKLTESLEGKCSEDIEEQEQRQSCVEDKDDDREDLEDHLNLEPDRMLVQELKPPRKLALHVGPAAGAALHLPTVRPCQQLSSQKICFSSYLERMCSQRRDSDLSKIRTSKRQRKDSNTEKEKESETKKIKVEESEPNRIIHIDETAIDGIELMANYKINQEDEDKPSTEDEKDIKAEDTAEDEVERDKDMSEREKDSFSELEDDEKYAKSDTDNESDHGKSEKTGSEKKFKNLKVKFRIRPKKRGGSIYTLVVDRDEVKSGEPKVDGDSKPQFDVETAMNQIRKGWSVHDAGDLTIGDLYLMFGSRSKLELDYWWAEASPPLRAPREAGGGGGGGGRGGGGVGEAEPGGLSPGHAASQDSNDGLSGDERRGEAPRALRLGAKLLNRPAPPPAHDGFGQMTDRLKRLLALVGNPYVSAAAIARCTCGHVCTHQRKQKQQPLGGRAVAAEESPAVFRHPAPIAPRPGPQASYSKPHYGHWTPDNPWKHVHKALSLEGVPRWRRGRPREAERRVVVQRLLPLLPKLPPPSNLIPVKIVPNSPPAPPRILPKPPPTSTSDLSLFYVLSESKGQFYFHDGDRRIPITPHYENGNGDNSRDDGDDDEDLNKEDIKLETTPPSTPQSDSERNDHPSSSEQKAEQKPDPDIGNFLPMESMSLSPSRLLRDAEGWLEGSVQDFSLSSFLGHLEGRPQPDLAESHLQSLLAESSVDYVAKFADLAAEVTDETNPLPSEDLP